MLWFNLSDFWGRYEKKWGSYGLIRLGNWGALGQIEDPRLSIFKSVQMELISYLTTGNSLISLFINVKVDVKNKEIETEEHMKQIAERQSGRLRNEIEKLIKE